MGSRARLSVQAVTDEKLFDHVELAIDVIEVTEAADLLGRDVVADVINDGNRVGLLSLSHCAGVFTNKRRKVVILQNLQHSHD